MSGNSEFPWDKLAAIFAGATLVIYIAWEPVRHFYRTWRLKRPCKAYFIIREDSHGELGYAIQDDKAHHLKELVLPSNKEVEIEVAYYPRINFDVQETVFGCEGDRDSKPEALKRVSRFVEKGKKEWVPGIDDSEVTNIKGYYHYRSRFSARAAGDCYTTGFILRTKQAGVYKTSLGFLTNAVSCGSEDLTIRVEDKPHTRMRCAMHSDCHVRPSIKSD